MHILFVCTGNICRSPMAELLMSRYLEGTSIQVSSAGTHGLSRHAIDPSSARLMDSVGIDSSGFHSRRLTRAMASSADLILCFERAQRQHIVSIAPVAVRYTFLLNEFADVCVHCAGHGLVRGLTIEERLQSVMDAAPLIRASMPVSQDIADPHHQDFAHFEVAADDTNRALRRILTSMRKHPEMCGDVR